MRGDTILSLYSRFLRWSEKAFAQIIIAAIMAFMTIAILLVVMIPVLNGINTATPTVVTNPLDVGNLSGGGGVLGLAMVNSTQTSLTNTIGSSFGLLVIVLLLLAVLAIIIVVGLFQYFIGGVGARQ